MSGTAASRGQPLLVFAGLLGAWLALRVAFWQPAFDSALLAAPHRPETPPHQDSAPAARVVARFDRLPERPAYQPVAFVSDRIVAQENTTAIAIDRAPRAAPLALPIESTSITPVGAPPPTPSPTRVAVGHSLLLAAGLSQMELPPALAAYLRGATSPTPGVPAAAPALAGLVLPAPLYTGSRLSADAWLMVRQDTTTPVASGHPSYGRSQAGAVVRYRLAPLNPHGAQAYARASSALAGPLEKDFALGLSGRLAPRVPLRFAAEARITETSAGTELRPAVIAVTEFPPLSLPLGGRAEAYLQGGYVGGKFATAFVDGQGRIERPIARFGEAEVSAGAGAWGGAQKGAARLDIGPTAAVQFRLGEARGRVAADYRFRVAGDAEPRSGPALTLSAGF